MGSSGKRSRRTRKLVGHTTFRDPDAGTSTNSREEVELDGRRVIVRIGPLDLRQPEEVIESTDRRIMFHTERIIRARRAHEYRYAPCQPDFKPKRRRPRLPDTVSCPHCGGTGEEDTGEKLIVCRTCGGLKEVERP